MDELVILWTSGDRETALNMVFMYAVNSMKRGWWEHVKIIVWGPSARLLSGDEELQGKVAEFIDAGGEVEACKSCADRYGVSDSLEELGIKVYYIGEAFTEVLKSTAKVISV